MPRIQSLLILLVMCTAVRGQALNTLEFTSGTVPGLELIQPYFGVLHERTLQPGDTFEFAGQATDEFGELSNFKLYGERLQPFSYAPCSPIFGSPIFADAERRLDCWQNHRLLMASSIRDLVIPVSVDFDPVEGISGSFVMPEEIGAAWAFHLEGDVDLGAGAFTRHTTHRSYIFPASASVPEPSGLLLLVIGLLGMTGRRPQSVRPATDIHVER